MSSNVSNDSPDAAQTRVIAFMLIATAVLLNYAALSWVLPLHMIAGSLPVKQIILAGQGLLASIAVLVLFLPVWFARRPSLSKFLLGVGSLGLVMGLVGNFGSWFSPPIG
jgi:hypothetical protein